MKKLLAVIILVLIIPEYATGQSFYQRKRDRPLIAYGGTGISSYYGELNNPDDRLDTKLNINIGIRYQIDERFSVRGNLLWFRLEGSDIESEFEPIIERNLSFRSDNIELTFSGTAFLRPEGLRFYQRHPINAFATVGAGLMRFNPKAIAPESFMGTPIPEAGEYVALQPLQTEGVKYSRITPVIMFGGGITGKISQFVNILVEGGYRITFTDYIDDASTVHKDPASFTDILAASLADRRHELGIPLAPEGHVRGNPDRNDGYFILNLKIEYYLPPNFFLYDILFPNKLMTIKRRRRPRGR